MFTNGPLPQPAMHPGIHRLIGGGGCQDAGVFLQIGSDECFDYRSSTAALATGGDRRRGQLSRRLSLLLIAPLVLLLGWTFFLPIARLLLTSFTEPAFGFANYTRLWTEPLYLQVFIRTLWIATACTVFALILGYPVAMLMARHGGSFAIFATMCVLIPLWTSVLVRSYAWVIVLERNGLINSWLMARGLISQPLKLLYITGAVLMAMKP